MYLSRFFSLAVLFIVLQVLVFAGCDGSNTRRTVSETDKDSVTDEDSVTDDPEDSDTAADESTADEDSVSAKCGNSIVEQGELCDGNVKNCAEIDPVAYISGKAKCDKDCMKWDTSTCEENPYECGNSVVEGNEKCDGGVKNCVEIDADKYIAGKAKCLEDCTGFDTATCEEKETPDEDSGNTGDTGDTGDTADTGDTGDTGNTGNTGDTSDTGDTGNTGDTGDTAGDDDVTAPYCGDLIVNGTDVCDGNTANCADLGYGTSGTATCKNDCTGFVTAGNCTKVFYCNTKPATGTVWNTVSSYTQTWTGTNWNPADDYTTEYNVTSSSTTCRYTCDAGYVYNGVSCVLETAPCGSVKFDGTSGYVEVLHNAVLNLSGSWTIEAWFMQYITDGQTPVIRKGNTTTSPAYYLYGHEYQIFFPSNAYGGYYYDSSNSESATAATELDINKWYHVAVVKTASNLKIFVNGVLESTETTSYNPLNNSENLFFGSRRSSTPSYMQGLVDEIRISSTARYSSNFTPDKRFSSDASTIGLWHFEETAGTVADNAAGSGLDGTLKGGATWTSQCVDNYEVPVPEIVDTIGSSETNTAGSSRMRGNFYSVTTAKTITEIEAYLTLPDTGATIYYDVYESTALDGTYTHKVSYNVPFTLGGESFYSSGAIAVSLEAGKYYYIGVRWGTESVTYYYNTAVSQSYTTNFGKWENGLSYGTTTRPDSFAYSSTYIENSYYQRITSK
ncbi:MAG TPA: LamG domain-containing protein [bacterium]|nr:LamG domain-containing protein [bacterium]